MNKHIVRELKDSIDYTILESRMHRDSAELRRLRLVNKMRLAIVIPLSLVCAVLAYFRIFPFISVSGYGLDGGGVLIVPIFVAATPIVIDIVRRSQHDIALDSRLYAFLEVNHLELKKGLPVMANHFSYIWNTYISSPDAESWKLLTPNNTLKIEQVWDRKALNGKNAYKANLALAYITVNYDEPLANKPYTVELNNGVLRQVKDYNKATGTFSDTTLPIDPNGAELVDLKRFIAYEVEGKQLKILLKHDADLSQGKIKFTLKELLDKATQIESVVLSER